MGLTTSIFTLLAQLPAAPTGAIENWLISAAAIASVALLFKKLFLRKPAAGPETVSKTEFSKCQEIISREISALREKIDERFLSLGEKIETMRGEILNAGERRGDSIHRRLNELEAGLARVDERTRLRGQ